MKSLLILLALSAPAASLETKKELVLKEVGLAIQIPATFKPERKSKGSFAEYSFLPNSGSGRGKLSIRLVPNDADPEEYQKVLAAKLKTENATVIAQRIPDILDSKFAVTKYSKTEGAVSRTTITGTLFKSTAKKLTIEVSSATADFDKVEPSFNQVVETLRTLEGGPTKPDDVTPVVVNKYIIEDKPFKGKPYKAPKSDAVKAGDINLNLFHPKDAVFQALNDGSYLLRISSLQNPISLKFYNGNAVAPESAFNEAVNKDLENYLRVDLRLRYPQRITRSALTQGDSILRSGITKGEKPRTSLFSILSNNDAYVVVEYVAADPKSLKSDWKKLNAVLSDLSFFKQP